MIGALSRPCSRRDARACPGGTCPPHVGQWYRVFVRFSRWRTRGVWAQVRATLQAAG